MKSHATPARPVKLLLFIAFSLIILSGCSDSSVDDTVDTLVLGTGLGHGIVTGATDIFTGESQTGAVIICWSLETRHDMSGFPIRLLIEEKAGSMWNERRLFEYGIIQDPLIFYYIDSFYHDYGIGAFRATIFIGERDVVSKEYSVQSGG